MNPWFALARPKLAPFVVALVALGYGWAHWDRGLTLRGLPDLGLVLVSWLFLHAGTLWLNAGLDHDDGEVLFGEPVAVPSGIRRGGALALTVAVGLSAMAGAIPGIACLICALLAVAYSHPRLAWKGRPWAGPLVNLVGYGLLSPLAGWALVEVDVDLRTLAVWPVAAVGVLGTYFLAQAFHGEEDGARGYRTLVVTHGPRFTLIVARLCIGAAWLGGMGLCAAGWLPRPCLLGAPLFLWVDNWLARWARLPDGGTGAWARGATWRLFFAVCVGLLLAAAVYAHDNYEGRPVAGLATAAGHPPDRPLLPPSQMRAWEVREAYRRSSSSR